MFAPALPIPEGPPSTRIRDFFTEQVRVLLDSRSIRLGVVGVLLVVASLFSLVPTSRGIDPGLMFIVPVAICSIAGGLKEGLITALASAVLCAAYAILPTGSFDVDVFLGAAFTRFMLYGLIGLVLGAFAEAYHSVQSGLKQLASTDPLTRVANVARFYDELGVLETLAADFAVVLLDMDDLKALNDRFGHQAGSEAIQAVARTLRRVVRGSDCIARFGGDEFVLILKDADRAGAQVVLNRFREMLNDETLENAPGHRLSASVGIALFGEDGVTSEELLAAADAAMYADKRARKLLTA